MRVGANLALCNGVPRTWTSPASASRLAKWLNEVYCTRNVETASFNKPSPEKHVQDARGTRRSAVNASVSSTVGRASSGTRRIPQAQSGWLLAAACSRLLGGIVPNGRPHSDFGAADDHAAVGRHLLEQTVAERLELDLFGRRNA